MDTTVADNFDTYFTIRYAKTRQMREHGYHIRHEVYARELGWEPVNQEEKETDDCDTYSHVCLLQHRSTQKYAGTVRLVIPPCNRPSAPLPFETHCAESIWLDKVDPSTLERGSFGEISRLAVPSEFRRRKNEKGKTFILNEDSSTTIYTEEEKRNFPNIAIGLYLSSIALVDICHHEGVFVMMEPKLQRHLKRFGLPFEQVGEKMDFRGMRAMFYLPKRNLTSQFTNEIRELYDLLKFNIDRQIRLFPYNTTIQ
jgi:N-acyl amino acid synthase of PEP-CTERM/exosortase system